jgi:exopolysaccharide biosynthesis polyprenyl glycosylphosphotransferase
LIQHAILKRGIGVHYIIIIGQDATTEQIVSQIYKKQSLGYKIVERYNDLGPETMPKIRERLERNKIDEIMQADSCLPKEQVLELKDLCHDHHIIFKYVPDLFETQAAHIDINTIADVPVIEVKRTKLDGWGKIFKRAFDVLLSFLLLIILSPIFLLVAVIIKIDSVGPVFFKAERVGEKAKTFTLYKFRSMVKDAHALKKELLPLNERPDGPLFKIKNDPRITRLGKFLRKTSLDELPQLINVLRGEMSLVGPRPHEPEEVARYQKIHKKLLAIKPGMTGLAQISGRSDLKFDDEAKLDIYYIENWSPKLDFQVIFKTPWVVFAAKTSA